MKFVLRFLLFASLSSAIFAKAVKNPQIDIPSLKPSPLSPQPSPPLPLSPPLPISPTEKAAAQAVNSSADSSKSAENSTVTTAATNEQTKTDAPVVDATNPTNAPEKKADDSDEIKEKPKASSGKCLKGDELKKNVQTIIETKIPSRIKLPNSEKGEQIPLIMENGFLNIGSKSLSGEPSCHEGEDERQTFNFFVELKDLKGAFDWKLFNLFNNNFSESVLLTLNKLELELSFCEKKTDENKLSLKSAKLGTMETLQSKVNLPEKVVEIKVENQDINYIKSRITTFVESRAKDVIDKDLKDSIETAIKEALEGKISVDEKKETPTTMTTDLPEAKTTGLPMLEGSESAKKSSAIEKREESVTTTQSPTSSAENISVTTPVTQPSPSTKNP